MFIRKIAKKPLLALGWRFPLIRALSSSKPVILLYHGIPRRRDGVRIDIQIFEGHVRFLKQHFDFIEPHQLELQRKPLDKIQVLLTFDDGFRNQAENVAPILRRLRVPALFFVCSRHAVPGKYLWFSYLDALERHFRGNGFLFRGEFIDMSAGERRSSIQRLATYLLGLKPHPAAMYRTIDEDLPTLEDFVSVEEVADAYAGMTTEQMVDLASDPLFHIGAHTADHPFLSRCDPAEALRQMSDNKLWIERVCNQPCITIAYPSGDYSEQVVEQCQSLGFSNGHAVIPSLEIYPEFELPRIGIYSACLDGLGFKVQWGHVMRALRIRVG